MEKTFDIPHSEKNARNSEGAFLTLQDGSVIFIYTRYASVDFLDDGVADLAAYRSWDQGDTWEYQGIVLSHCRLEALNIMSVSLLRLTDGRILMHFLAKRKLADYPAKDVPATNLQRSACVECIPYVCFSGDECASWSEPEPCVTPGGYRVINNDRVVRLSSGRIVIPAAESLRYRTASGYARRKFFVSVIFSDDNGITWQEIPDLIFLPGSEASRYGAMEPGIVELEPHRLMLWCRSDLGCQYKCFSYDDGMTWTQLMPAREFPSPNAPLSIRRRPADKALVAVWNDSRAQVWRVIRALENANSDRLPLVMAESFDNAKTWVNHRMIESDNHFGYCYTAIHFVGSRTLLAYCCGSVESIETTLQDLRIRVLESR